MELVELIETGLGEKRLHNLKKNEDNYQIFWLGILEHRKDVDGLRDPVPYLISCGYGAIRNEYLKENTRRKIKYCPSCGKVYSYRKSVCPHCLIDNLTDNRISSITLPDGNNMEFPIEDFNLGILDDILTIQTFINSLYGKERYVAKRWLIDRADLKYTNHLKQIALELGCSAPYVAKVKKSIIKKFSLVN